MNSETFRNPLREFREIPFWSWNDDSVLEEMLAADRRYLPRFC